MAGFPPSLTGQRQRPPRSPLLQQGARHLWDLDPTPFLKWSIARLRRDAGNPRFHTALTRNGKGSNEAES